MYRSPRVLARTATASVGILVSTTAIFTGMASSAAESTVDSNVVTTKFDVPPRKYSCTSGASIANCPKIKGTGTVTINHDTHWWGVALKLDGTECDNAKFEIYKDFKDNDGKDLYGGWGRMIYQETCDTTEARIKNDETFLFHGNWDASDRDIELRFVVNRTAGSRIFSEWQHIKYAGTDHAHVDVFGRTSGR
ncbi:hypothetical protein [Nocardia sp. NPDC051570]|uniref:hypothetical protein n=1 Tax=Nocardia sp. NPDC051570 TaxID=3364324 RepID=UPI00379B1659